VIVKGQSAEGRRIRVYRLTAAGRRQLTREVEAWRSFSGAINLVLRVKEA
jgi:DNA-binding PadR family transcriptional regulator